MEFKGVAMKCVYMAEKNLYLHETNSVEPCDLMLPLPASSTMSCSGRLPISVSGGDTHRATIVLTKRPSTSTPSNTQVMLSDSSRQGPEMSTAVPPKTWPERGAISSVTVSVLKNALSRDHGFYVAYTAAKYA